MRPSLKTLAATALIGASIACVLASPALAARPLSQRYYTHQDIYGRLRATPRASIGAKAASITPMPGAGAAITTFMRRITRRGGARAAASTSRLLSIGDSY